jgi:S1-C subfamily serine protease
MKNQILIILFFVSVNSFSQIDLPDLTSESRIRDYFDKNGAELIEGIWDYSSPGTSEYRLAILKNGYKFHATIIEKTGKYRPGDLKATFETAATDEVLTIKWQMGNKRAIKKIVGTVKNNAVIDFYLNGKVMLYRVYPKFNKNNKQKRVKTGKWAGNGSGIIISKSGHIITNHHVIEDAEDIEVEFMLDNELQKFNAEIVQVDKTNDLAVLKIFDMNFDGVSEPPYNFKFRGSDVGTKVYAFGYPMALSIMGKEIKVTDGMISSKSGFDGNITTYQITAPIQAGNSGGPLFDGEANLIGINSSGIRKDIADNVSYSIKTSYVSNLIDVLPKSIELPSTTGLKSLPLTEQIKEISKYVVLIKVK